MTISGVGVSPGIGQGPVYVLTVSVPEPPEGATYEGEADQEKARAHAALEQVAGELEARGVRAGGEAKDVLAAQALMARDPGLAIGVDALIETGTAAPRAVYESFGKYRDLLVAAGGYMGQRVVDVEDVRDRTIAVLTGHPVPGVPTTAAEPYVLVARDLAPADTVLLTRDVVAAFVTEQGGPTSHTAILARAMGLPAVVAARGATALRPGVRVLVDGGLGTVTVEPSEQQVADARRLSAARARALDAATGPGRTADGHPVPLLANIGGPADVQAAVDSGAEGVGLYRTEFLFLDRASPPTREQQRDAYRAVLEAFPQGKVVVRTLDAGADKPLAFLPATGREPNPALGLRGLRMFRAFPEVMTDQLQALADAGAGMSDRLQVMAPMVSTVDEATWFVHECTVKGLGSVGVMIEVPAAALRSKDLAATVGFLSIGTNDLAQYAFAADRQVGALSALQDPWHPALLDLIAAAVGDHGVPCGVCGEAAADPALACVLVGLGAATLSMSPAALPAVRAGLAAHSLAQCRRAAAMARGQVTAAGARNAARAALPGLADLGL
ncbi:phosphoenolpyruvate--protein phosphotransferase [Nonomuraea sp. NPDC003804]|uniref:phosphoenolpyruvate--protein phosphotransferase n=1 Tax=Nonomuraea sp. NPDC003804 TaxID=3154547 RepID=UPI0033A11C5C